MSELNEERFNRAAPVGSKKCIVYVNDEDNHYGCAGNGKHLEDTLEWAMAEDKELEKIMTVAVAVYLIEND